MFPVCSGCQLQPPAAGRGRPRQRSTGGGGGERAGRVRRRSRRRGRGRGGGDVCQRHGADGKQRSVHTTHFIYFTSETVISVSLC